MILLKILGYLLLLLLLTLVLAFVLPASADIRYEAGELKRARLRVLFLGFDLNKEKKPKKKKGPAQPETAAPKPPKKGLLERVRQLGLDTSVLPELLEPVGSLLGKVIGSIRVCDISLCIVCGGATPEEIGTNTGRAWAAIGAVSAALCSIFRLTFEDVTVVPDFALEHKGSHMLAFTAKGTPAALLLAAAVFLLRIKKLYKQHKKTVSTTTDMEGEKI